MARLISLASFVFLVFSSAASAQEGLWVPLHGRVHTLLTETERLQYLDGSQEELRATFSVYQVFNDRGAEIENTFQGPDGRLIGQKTVTLDDDGRIVREVLTTGEPGGTSTTERFYDTQGRETEVLVYNASGNAILQVKKNMDSSVGDLSAGGLGPSGGAATEIVDSQRQDPETGEAIDALTRNGKLESKTRLQRDASGNLLYKESKTADGSSCRVDFQPDGTQTEDCYSAPDKTRTHKTTDSRGRVSTFFKESPPSYTRREYRYDGADRLAEVAEYDSSGKPISRETTEYRDDPAHNWIEQKWTRWDMQAAPPKPTLILLNRRTIEYYE